MDMSRTSAVALKFFGILLLALVAASPVGPNPAATQEGISVFFSPKGGCTGAVIEQINAAAHSIDVQAYSFTSAPIAKALVDAHQRGVVERVILDSSQRSEKYSSATFLRNAGIPTFIDDKHAIAHNKIILIDGQTIITGSFNFTKAAEESNAENLLIIKNKSKVYKAYEQNFTEHLGHSVEYGSTISSTR
jgi:phosphatidylserine/phosphatidylglycerophosphate/cardiolipin synthase-like enzyme